MLLLWLRQILDEIFWLQMRWWTKWRRTLSCIKSILKRMTWWNKTILVRCDTLCISVGKVDFWWRGCFLNWQGTSNVHHLLGILFFFLNVWMNWTFHLMWSLELSYSTGDMFGIQWVICLVGLEVFLNTSTPSWQGCSPIGFFSGGVLLSKPCKFPCTYLYRQPP